MYIYITRSGAASAPKARAADPGDGPSPAAEGQAAASGAPNRPRAPPRPSGAATGRSRASPSRRGAPVLQERRGPLELLGRDPVCPRVLDERNAPCGNRAVAGGKDVRDRQRVGDDERAPLDPREHEPEAARVSLDDVPPALTAAGNQVTRRCGAGPRAVGLEFATLVATVARVVQLGNDEARYVASRQC